MDWLEQSGFLKGESGSYYLKKGMGSGEAKTKDIHFTQKNYL